MIDVVKHYSFARDVVADTEDQRTDALADRRAVALRAAAECGLLGVKERTIGGRFSDALVEEAKRVTGITDNIELLTCALIRPTLEDDFGERLLARRGRVPAGTLFAG